MDEEIKQLKSVLRSLVVSSPTQVDVRSLCRDYRNMVGQHIPTSKFGYKDPVSFLRERFSDCFLFQGPSTNPELTLIVPDSLKHIDKFVQKQKTNPNNKFKGKRRSVPASVVQPVEPDLIVKSFKPRNTPTKEQIQPKKDDRNETKEIINYTQSQSNESHHEPRPIIRSLPQNSENKSENTASNSTDPQSALQNFLKRRTAPYCSQHSSSDQSSNDKASSKGDDDSGRQTSSSSSGCKRMQLEELKQELRDIIFSHRDGVWCADLLRLYRERYGRELIFPRFGFSSVLSVACAMPDVGVSRQAAGDWLLSDARAAAPPLAAPPRAPAPRAPPPRAAPDPDDALPGVAFEPDVFPEDCIHFLESIPSPSLAGVGPGTMLEVAVAEVYSPSHFWLLRLGERYNIAMEEMMDEMNEYYTRGEGRDRALAPGAVRVGHYCCSLYDGDWHRSLIVKVIDADTVKVRHVDYGTVERRAAHSLRALRRQWARLEAQAVRARLAGVRPPAAGRRWPRAAAHHFLRLVRDRRLVANVVAADAADGALEVLLIDTATRDDRSVAAELLRAGHADPRASSALGTSECYLYPRFEALESGDTPNFAEIHAYLRDGIALEFVDDYRRHVPPCLPAADPPPAPAPPAAPAPPPAPTLPPAAAPPGGVSLSAAECELFALLSRADPAAARRYMAAAVSRAMWACVRPPPGFEAV